MFGLDDPSQDDTTNTWIEDETSSCPIVADCFMIAEMTSEDYSTMLIDRGYQTCEFESYDCDGNDETADCFVKLSPGSNGSEFDQVTCNEAQDLFDIEDPVEDGTTDETFDCPLIGDCSLLFQDNIEEYQQML